MNPPRFEMADVFRRYGEPYFEKYPVSPEQFKVFNLMKICRTSKLGGHLEKCGHCDYERPAYNSCRNRHCPKCQGLAREKWLDARCGELLPTGYFHGVFTLPHLLNLVISCNKKECLGLLFQTVNEVLGAFARDPQWRLEGRIGFIGILHTWSQTLMDHFHLHCLIPAGVLSFDETRWTPTRKKFLFRTSSLGKAFRRIYLEKLRRLYDHQALKFPGKAAVHGTPEGFESLLRAAFRKKWVIFAKRPFSGPAEVLKYLGRYTHRVAISNHRIVSIGNNEVTFTYRDRRDNDQVKQMTVDALAFIRRFLRHVLPDGFMKIRYFGFLSHRHKCRCIPLIRSLIGPGEKPPVKSEETTAAIIMRLTGADITCCPECGGRLRSYPLPVPPEMMEATPANTS